MRGLTKSVAALADCMAEMPQLVIVPVHTFTKGWYQRTITLPAGACIVGEQHGKRHIVHIISGEVSIVTDGVVQTLIGPAVYASAPGDQRVAFTHTEVVWATHHENPDDTRDVQVLRERLIVPRLLK